MNITDAIERFALDHPEYAASEEALRIAEIAMNAYMRYQFEAQPLTIDLRGMISNWEMCALCHGKGRIDNAPPTFVGSFITEPRAVSEVCALCKGAGGFFK